MASFTLTSILLHTKCGSLDKFTVMESKFITHEWNFLKKQRNLHVYYPTKQRKL